MMTKKTLLALSLALAAAASAQNFRAEAVRAHMQFLADDLLEGRGTGARGYRIAAQYVAAQYELIGLEPGANGSWFQEVPLRETKAAPTSTLTFTREGAEPLVLRIFQDFTSSGSALEADKIVDAEVVFAGFGVTAPEQKYDDYAKVDVRGKIAAIFSGAPKQFPNAIRAHHSSSQGKVENAARHGAVGLIYLESPEDALRSPWERGVRQSKLGAMHWLRADGTPNAVHPVLNTTATLSPEATRKVLGSEAAAVFAAVDAGRPQPRPLAWRARMQFTSSHRDLRSPNVIGLLRGSDPELRDEYLVYSSHLDHVGITEPVDGDAINNGAFDNASGIAAMIEIARAFAALPQRPRRSILFLATTAEEKGLRGADYFANNPTVPAGSVVGNINMDMLLLTHRTRDLVAYGVDTNDLGDLARDVARQMNIELSPEPFPEEVIFVRSDQYPFVRRGIPAIYINPGYKGVDPKVDVAADTRRWMRTRYHSPKDDLEQPIDYAAALPLIEFDFRLGLAAANRDQRPRWKPGDFFGETFAK